MGKRHRLTNILFLAPAVISFSLVMIVPFFLGIYYSMTDFNGIRSVLTFVGFETTRPCSLNRPSCIPFL